jgi:hypothetical protein
MQDIKIVFVHLCNKNYTLYLDCKNLIMKKELLLKVFPGILFWIFTIPISAQTAFIPDTLNNNVATEKIYIHFDKPYYAAGETIWFKGYVYDKGLPSVSSNNLYLQFNRSGRKDSRN